MPPKHWRTYGLSILLTTFSFLLESAAFAANSAVIPVARTNAGWIARHEAINQRARQGGVDLIYVGDSIVEHFDNQGKEVWQQYYAPRHALNLGISGDRTEHVLWRLDHGNVDGINPKLAIVMIGQNNGGHNSGAEIGEGVTAIVQKLHAKLPSTKLLLLGIFQRREKPTPERAVLAQANEIVSKLADGKDIVYMDINYLYVRPDGTISRELMYDFEHPTPLGHRVWAEAIEAKVVELMGDSPIAPVQAAQTTLPEATQPATNLVLNGFFEEMTGEAIRGWKSRAWAGEAAARWSLETPGRTGTRCLSIASEKGADAAWTTTVAVKPNTSYRLSGWIKTKEVRGAVGALLNLQNLPEARTTALAGTKDWTRVATIFRSAAATEVDVNCLFGGWGSATGQAWFDDIALEELAGGTNDLQATVTVNPDAPAVTYSPMIFGGFLEHFDHQIYGGVFEPGSPLADRQGFRRDVIAALKELKVPVVRWPGGCFASGYHWESGVGKVRRSTEDMAWGVAEPNTFGTDEFVELCRLLGWQPYICNNAGNGTIAEMKNWVEYCNASAGAYAERRQNNGYARPRNVRLWSIGNENWGAHEIGYKPIEQWAPLVRDAAQAMKAADPHIQLTAAALPTREWTLPLLQLAGPYLDFISIHSYWLPLWGKNEAPDYLSAIMHSESPERLIADFVGVLDDAGYRGRIKIAFDEWNLRGWHHEGFPRKEVQDRTNPEVQRLIAAREKNDLASQYTMADALFSASFLNACLRHAEDVGMANIAPLVNTRGPLYVYPGGIVKRAHFHTLALYANELQPQVVPLDLESGNLVHGNRVVPVVDAIATVSASHRRWAVALVNRHPDQSVSCTLSFKGRPLEGTYPATVLEGDSPEAYNDIEHPRRVQPRKTRLPFVNGAAHLPPHSLTIVQISL